MCKVATARAKNNGGLVGSQFEPVRVRKPDRASRPVPRPRGAALRRERSRNGGGGGIRTLDRLAPITVFETAAFDHSATPPDVEL
jgi:hypothetical protein